MGAEAIAMGAKRIEIAAQAIAITAKRIEIGRSAMTIAGRTSRREGTPPSILSPAGTKTGKGRVIPDGRSRSPGEADVTARGR
jgi:hypothetical protein